MNFPNRSNRRALRPRALFLLTAAAAVPGFISREARADKYWINSVTNGSWSLAANWNASSPTGAGGAGIPGSADNVFLNNTTSSLFTITLNETDTISSLTIGNTGGGTDTLSEASAVGLAITNNLNIGSVSSSIGQYSLSSGTVTVSGNAYLGGSSSGAGGTGTLAVSGGTFTAANTLTIYTNGNLTQGPGGLFNAGTITQSGGNASFSQLDIDSAAGVTSGANIKSYTLSGGTMSTEFEYVAYSGTATLTLSGGTNTITSGGELDVGASTGARGTYTVSGGSLSDAGNLDIAGSFGSAGGMGTMSLSAGTVSVTGTTYLFANGALYQTGGHLQTGTFNQSGGSVSFTGLSVDTSFGTAALGTTTAGFAGSYTLSGGTLFVNGTEVIGTGSTSVGTLTQSGGTNTVTGSLEVGAGAGSKGTVALSGTGSLSVSGNVWVGGTSSGAAGTGTLAISGGTITVSGASGITLYSGSTLTQSAGTVTTPAVNINAGTYSLSGGTLANATLNLASGTFNVMNATLSAVNVTGGNVVVPQQTTLYIQNGLTIPSHNLNASLSSTTYFDGGSQTFNNGTINATASQAQIDVGGPNSPNQSTTLTLGSTATLSGPFEIYNYVNNGNYSLINNGTINSNSSGNALYIETTNCTNNGLAEAISGGTLEIDSTSFTNNGTINVGAGSTLRIFSTNLTQAGTLTTASTALTIINGGTTSFSGGTVQNAGSLTVTTAVAGTPTTVKQSSVGVTIGGPLSVAPVSGDLANYNINSGTLACQSGALIGSVGSGTFAQTNGATTVTGALSAGNTGTLTSGTGSGTITVSGGTLYADTVLLGSTAGGAGQMTVSGTGSVTIGGGAHLNDLTVNAGTVTVLAQAAPAGEDPELYQALVGGYLTNGALYVNGGTVTSPNIKLGLTQGYTGTFDQTAGTVNVGTLGAGNDATLTSGKGTGVVNISGGVLDVNTILLGSTVGGAAQMTVSGTGSVTIGGGAHLNDLTVNAGTVTVLAQAAPAGEDPELYQALVGGYLTNGALYVNGGNVTSPNIKLGLTQSFTGTFGQTGGSVNVTTLSVGDDASLSSGQGMGVATISGGTLNVGTLLIGSTAGGVGTVTVSGTAAVLVSNSFTVTSGSTFGVSGGSLTASGVTNNGSMSFTGGFSGFTTIDGTGTFNVTSGASLAATHVRQKTLNIGSNSTLTIADSANPGTTTATSVLTDLTNSGTLDLKNNDLIITDSTQFAAVKTAITSAYNGGAWNQAGITSSSAKVHPISYGLGYSTAGAIGTTAFDGQTGLASGTVLVKYTLLGDTHLTGTVGLADYNVVLANLNTGTLWSQGAFHAGSTSGLGDYNAVLANFNVTANGSLASPSARTSSATIKAASISLSPAVVTSNAATDMKLEVNTLTGDVFAVATTATALTGYDIFDSSNHLLDSGDPNTDLNELLLSQPTTNRGNTTTFRNATNYKLWTTILDNASTLAEGENNGKLKQGTASTYDTINIPSGGTIDFGHVYATATNKQDYTFSFSEADPTNSGNPVTGTTYGAEVDYVNTNSTPEPGILGLLGMGGVVMMRRRRK